MRIFHKFCFVKDENPGFYLLIEKHALEFKKRSLYEGTMVTFQVAEDHPAWNDFRLWVGRDKIIHAVETVFSQDEILAAEWVRLVGIFGYLYPQPVSSWVSNPINYGSVCKDCGTFEQISSFRIKGEPNLRKNDFMSLEWTGETLFARPGVIRCLLDGGINGFDVWPVIIHKTEQMATSIQQIRILNRTEPGLLPPESMRIERCARCGQMKYEYHHLGKMHYRRSALPTDVDILLTDEWFGAGMGHHAFREILISNPFVRLILEKGWKGFRMKVVELQ